MMVPETAGGILVDCSHAYPHPDQEVWAGRLSSLPAQAWKAPSHFWLIVLSRPRHLGRGQGWGGDEGGGGGHLCPLLAQAWADLLFCFQNDEYDCINHTQLLQQFTRYTMT